MTGYEKHPNDGVRTGELRHRSAGVRLRTMVVACLTGIGMAASALAAEMRLAGGGVVVDVDPATLKLACSDADGHRLVLSEGLSVPGLVQGLEQTASYIRWRLPELGLDVRLSVLDRTCSIRLKASEPSELAWPKIQFDTQNKAQALMVPRDEGSYVPLDDPEWMDHLVAEGRGRLVEGFSMPFIGIDFGEVTATVISATPFNTGYEFQRLPKGVAMALKHQFTRLDRTKDYGFVVRFGAGSPVEPAKVYRQWLQEQEGFVSFATKMKSVPRAERLLGAMHAYLWEAGYMHRLDVKNWPQFCTKLVQESATALPSPARHLYSSLSPVAREAVQRLSKPGGSIADQELVIRELNVLLDSAGLYNKEAWNRIPLPDDTSRFIRAGLDRALPSERCQANAAMLVAAFRGGEFEKLENWGDGISVRMLKDLQNSGVDRACLVLNDLGAGRRRPEIAQRADQMGYAYGAYDSYHSLHVPSEPDTWATAQFDMMALENGPILRRDGTREPGFKGKGFKFSPLVARPYVERRVTTMMVYSPFSAWFVDCDATGESYDNYSEVVPATEGSDFAARMERLQWISRSFNVPVGSEKGMALASSALFFAHGMLTPPLNWRDPDFKDANSPYYMGNYTPEGAPSLFFKPVRLKPSTRKFFLDPYYRLPLYQIAFHDSVVTTHHWTSASLKFEEERASTALVEQLYNLPPLYHLNRDTWLAQSKQIVARHKFFGPLHRELGLHPMTDFLWLTSDRTIQMTTFANGTYIVANFSNEPWQSESFKLKVPAKSVAVRRPKGGPLVLTP